MTQKSCWNYAALDAALHGAIAGPMAGRNHAQPLEAGLKKLWLEVALQG